MRDKPLFISCLIGFFVYGVLLVSLFTPLRGILSPFVTSAVLVYMLSPLVRAFEKRHIKSAIAVALVYALFLCAGVFVVIFAMPKIYEAVIAVIKLLQEYAGEIGGKIQWRIAGDGAGKIYRTVVFATKGALNAVVSFVAAFYILCDLKGLKTIVEEIAPQKLIASLKVIGDDVKSAFDAFFKGQLLIAIVLFVIDAIFLYVMKIPYAIGLAFIAAVLDIVPYAGAIVAMGVILIVTALSAPDKIIIVVIGLLVIQQIENNIITPKISSDTLKVHPAVTVLALYAGAFGGFWGILLSIPLVSVFQRLTKRLIQSIL